MKCPLFAEISKHQEERGFLTHIDCLGKECAWYDESSDACAIWSVMSGLDALGKVLREIEQKLPLGR